MSVYPRDQRISNKKDLVIGLRRLATKGTRSRRKFLQQGHKGRQDRSQKIPLCGLCDLAVKIHSLMPSWCVTAASTIVLDRPVDFIIIEETE
jgi:hypothetical protein